MLRGLHQMPQVSRRALARNLGVALGTINFCFQALVEKGLVEMQNFSQSKNKFRYTYFLTPVRVAGKSKLTAEYGAHQVEIETLKAQLNFSKGGPQ